MHATRMQAALWRMSALCSIAISTACTTPEAPPPRVVTEIQRVEMRHPDALLVCDQDLLPPPPGRTAQQALDFLDEKDAAGADCRAKLACIRRRQAGEECG